MNEIFMQSYERFLATQKKEEPVLELEETPRKRRQNFRRHFIVPKKPKGK